jgi:cytochrome P450
MGKAMQTQHPSEGRPLDPREGAEFFMNVPEKLDNPFPDFQYFRENRPVFYYAPLNSWFVFRYDDVHGLFHDSRLSANRMKGLVELAPEEVRGDLARIAPYLESWMLMKDGNAHARLRRLMQEGFTPALVDRMSDPIRQSAEGLLDQGIQHGRLDSIGQYGFLLPAYVLSDLFGVSRADAGRLVQWSLDFVNFFNNLPITVETSQGLVRSGFAMIEYTRALIAARRAQPTDDFLGTLCAAHVGQTALTDDEIAGNVMLLLLAGHVAVSNLIGNVVYLLLTHPDQFARLKADPALLHNAIEETLRYEPPITMTPRLAAEDIDWQGYSFRQGQMIQLNLASANRDAAHFSDPDRFDITRPPGKHLAFGTGVHGCIGATLAREVATIGVATLLRRMPGVQLDESRPIRWYRNAANRGPFNLPVIDATI